MLALSRSWVHYEVFLALQREGNLRLCFPRDVSTAEFKRFEAACRQLDPLSGSASRADDKARILGEVRRLGVGAGHSSSSISGNSSGHSTGALGSTIAMMRKRVRRVWLKV